MDLVLGLVLMGALAWLLLRNRATPGRNFQNLFSAGGANGTQTSQAPAAQQVGPVQEAAPQAQAPLSVWQTPAAGLAYQAAFDAATVAYGLPGGLLSRMAWEESHYDPTARSGAGAIGLMQFLPTTAADFGIDPTDAQAAIDAAGKYMAQLYRRFGDWRTALAAYNWGQGNVAHYGTARLPAKTSAYVSGIAGDLGF